MLQCRVWWAASAVTGLIAISGCGDGSAGPPESSVRSREVLRHLDLSVRGQDAPELPATYGDPARKPAFERAMRERKDRLVRAGRDVVQRSAARGVRGAEVVTTPLLAYVRVRMSSQQAEAALALPAVASVRPAVVRRGRIERYDVGWVLVTADGARYALNWQIPQPTDLRASDELTVEGVEDDGPAFFFAPGATGLLVRALARG